MKRTVIIIATMLFASCLTACDFNVSGILSQTSPEELVEANSVNDSEHSEIIEEQMLESKPELSQVRAICKLATLECYYHNVARSTKEKGDGLSHLGEKDRRFWKEYSGSVKLGVDMSRGSMDVDGSEITIYIPEAEILSIKIISESVSDTIMESDGLNKNVIGTDDITKAVNDAQQEIRLKIENDSSLLVNAQDRAKKLIENYVKQIGSMSGVDYSIKWVTVHNSDNDGNDVADSTISGEV